MLNCTLQQHMRTCKDLGVSSSTGDTGWVLVSDAVGRHFPTTGVLHHVNGCGLDNGRNRLRPATEDEHEDARRCARCEARIATGSLPARAVVGTKDEVRLLDEVVASLDSLAAQRGESRAAVLRELVITGLGRAS
jgi:hypothetical protein